MDTGVGFPSKIYPRQGYNPNQQAFALIPVSLEPFVPMSGQQSVLSGRGYDFKTRKPLQLVTLILDIPTDVTCDVSVDEGAPIVSVNDSKGLQFAIPYGDLAARVATRITSVRLTGVNTGSSTRDVRAWGVCIL